MVATPVLASSEVYLMDDIFQQIAAYATIDVHQHWYCTIIQHFPRFRKFSTYPYPTSIRLQTHQDVVSFINEVIDWELKFGRRIRLDHHRRYANINLLEAPSPPSRHFANSFASIFPLLSLTDLNLHVGWDINFMDKVRQIGLAYGGLRTLRIKHIVNFNIGDTSVEFDENWNDQKRIAFDAQDIQFRPRPWASPSWPLMLSAFSSLRIFSINTPLLLTRNENEDRYVKDWAELCPTLCRVYIYHGYDWDYNFQLDLYSRGAGIIVYTTNLGRTWTRDRVPAVGFPWFAVTPLVATFMCLDDDKFGPQDDVPNGLLQPTFDLHGDCRLGWYSDDDDDEDHGNNVDTVQDANQ
ncbi:hypothetical protein BDN72DRAFT_863114 [Pluteus cervinus]|uniref:Uncharacterized protein n=1 Tax=Pluteus cervinus TaxID=181527 RepID=A0ACD3A875_9AGAR|nr:hypothetical protein BDN72DRAFT_863114 [Pluteus cervinus]